MKNEPQTIQREAWGRGDEPAANEKEFSEFITLLERDIANGARSENCRSYRYGRRMISAHFKR
jgi:hypothetical protein